MKITEYFENSKDENRNIITILSQYGFSVIVRFGFDNKTILFEFYDIDTDNILFILTLNSHEEAINLMTLLNYIIELD